MMNEGFVKHIESGSEATQEFRRALNARKKELDELPPLPKNVRKALARHTPIPATPRRHR